MKRTKRASTRDGRPSNGKRGNDERAAQKRVRAFELRKAGKTFREISVTLGIDVAAAHRLVMSELRMLYDLTREHAIELRQLELEKLDRLENKARPLADKGSAKHQMVMLRVSQQRARLLGLEAAVKHEVSGPNGQPIAVDDARSALAAAIAGLSDSDAAPSVAPDADSGPADAAPRETP